MGSIAWFGRGYRIWLLVIGLVFVLLQATIVSVVHAAGISVSSQNLSITSESIQYSDIDATNYEHLVLSFHYNAEKLEAGDALHYGWKTSSEEGLLGTIDGRTESVDDPMSDTDETGDIVLLALPDTLANAKFQLFFQNTGTISGTNDQVDISLIQVGGDSDITPPTIPIASPLPGNYNTAKAVTLASSDNLSEHVSIYYTTDGSTPDKKSQLYVSPIEVGVSQTIKAVAYDATGNASGVAVLAYVIDAGAPIITSIRYSNAGAATNTDVMVTMTTNEAVDTPEGWNREADTVFTKKYSENTEESIMVTDLAGNISESKTVEVRGIDKIAPVILISGSGENDTYSGSVLYTASDNKEIQQVMINGMAAAISGTLSEPGEYTLVATDTVGNSFTKQLLIVIPSPPAIGEEVAKPPAVLVPLPSVTASTTVPSGRSALTAISSARPGVERKTNEPMSSDSVTANGSDKNKEDETILAPSEQGWKLLGIAWYWYALVTGLLGVGWWLFRAKHKTAKDIF